MSLSLTTDSHDPRRVTVQLHGRLDASTYQSFDASVQALLPALTEGGTMVLDLAALEYISSAGLRSLARIRKAMRQRDGQALLLNPQAQVRKVFDIVKAVPVNEIFVSASEMDAYLDRIQQQILNGDDDD